VLVNFNAVVFCEQDLLIVHKFAFETLLSIKIISAVHTLLWMAFFMHDLIYADSCSFCFYLNKHWCTHTLLFFIYLFSSIIVHHAGTSNRSFTQNCRL